MESKPFDSVRYNTNHVLHQLLPPEKDIHYNLRQLSHSLTLPSDDNNLIRNHTMLFREVFVLCYCILFHHFNAFENFTSYVTLYLYLCWCHGLRLP